MSSIDSFFAAAVQMVSEPNLTKNLARAAALIADAAKQGANLVVLPENFALFGSDDIYSFGAAEESNECPIRRFLSEQARVNKVWLVAGTVPRVAAIAGTQAANGAKVYAACHIYNAEGVEVGRYDKIHLFDAAVDDAVARYCESSTYAPGNQLGVVKTPWGQMGVCVCYDLRFPEYFRLLAQQDVHFLVVPSAFTYSTGAAHWEVLLRARAIENQFFVIASNQGGWHSDTKRTYGHSCIVNPWGTVLKTLPAGEGIVISQISLKEVFDLRQKMPVLSHRRF